MEGLENAGPPFPPAKQRLSAQLGCGGHTLGNPDGSTMTKLVFDRSFTMNVPASPKPSTESKGISETTGNVLAVIGSLVGIGALALISPWLAIPVMAVFVAVVL